MRLNKGASRFEHGRGVPPLSQLSAANSEAPLEADDLVLLAQAALLIGRDADGSGLLAVPIKLS